MSQSVITKRVYFSVHFVQNKANKRLNKIENQSQKYSNVP